MSTSVDCRCHTTTESHTDISGVVGRAEDEFRRTVVPGADVADVGLACDKNRGRAKVTELEDAGGRVKEEVMRLDVAMADADGVNVHERTEELVHIQLDLEHGHGLLELGVVPAGTVHGLWDIFEHKIEVHFVFLRIEDHQSQSR